MARGADLHLHSWYSDGTLSPREIVAYAARHHVNPIALTDHDTVAGIPEALHAGSELAVEVIPGVELSVHEPGEEMHILGYFIQWENTTFQGTLDLLATRRRDRLVEILRRLDRLGVPLSQAAVREIAGPGTVGRLHVARALVARRAVGNVQEAFDRFLAQGRPAYVERTGFNAAEAITAIRDAAGIAVLAHPDHSALDRLTSLVHAGLQGIEVFHPSHRPEDVIFLTRLASEHGLLITGGSDCHGLGKGDLRLGQITLALEYVERLRSALPPRHPASNP